MLNRLNRYKYNKDEIKRAVRGVDPPAFMDNPAFRVVKGKLFATIGPNTLRVVANEDRDDLLRKALYTPGSGYPFGRDSLFAALKTRYLNVSKRDIETFLKKQKILVERRSRPPKEKRVQVRTKRSPGVVGTDLVHVRIKDFKRLFKKRGLTYLPGEGKHDRYFLNTVELHTGYMLSDLIYGKSVEYVLPKLAKQMERFKVLMGFKVKRVESDFGSEFKGAVIDMLEKKKIRHVMRRTNAAIEAKNAHMQRSFWVVVAQKRSGWESSLNEAVVITNNTLNRTTGLAPVDAMKIVRQGGTVPLKRVKSYAMAKKKAYPLGTWVRALQKVRAKTSLGFKRYKGKTFTKPGRITKITWYGPYPKYQVAGKYYFHDQVIKVAGAHEHRPVDVKSERLVQLRIMKRAPPV